jgi:hypothetical protein
MKNLKWIIGFLILTLTIVSCLDDEPTLNAVYNYKAIDSVQIGEIHPARQVTEIKTFYTRTNNCEDFFNYQYDILGNERSVVMIIAELQSNDCEEINETSSNTLQFKPENSGTYNFRFWNGVDENGQDVFIEKEIEIP